MTFSKNDRVRLLTRREWGVGLIKDVKADGKVLVKFGLLGDKLLTPASNLQVVSDSAFTIGGLDLLVKYFLGLFPNGFQDPKYLEYERNYKVTAHTELLNRLGKDEFADLIAEEQFEEICSRALYLIGKTNLVNQFESMALKNRLIERNQQKFAEALFNSLYKDASLETRFEIFDRCLCDLEASKWTLQTYFFFFRFPETCVFLKPTESQKVADECGFELNYKPEVNWNTYKKWLDVAASIQHSLVNLSAEEWTAKDRENLIPRDYIDVQSFVWTAIRLKEGKYNAD